MSHSLSSESLAFFRAFLKNPRRIASAMPSGTALAKIIVRDLPLGAPILELGAGTGVFTRAMLELGVAERDLILVEQHSGFAAQLEARHPAAHVLAIDASRISGRMPPTGLAAVVSSLPFLTMRSSTTLHILTQVFSELNPGGAFYQFTYGPRVPISKSILERLDLASESRGFTWRNFPPARVYKLVRREDQIAISEKRSRSNAA